MFEHDAVLEIELTGPISTLLDNKPERDDFPFTLRADGIEHPIEVSLRGKSRLRVCEFPPLRLKFGESKTAGTIFAGQGKLRLVTHCRNYDGAEQDALLEYVAYRIFNLLSEIGYRVRLLKITYSDVDGRLDSKARNRYGFLIESTSGLADRIGATPIAVTGITRGSLNPEHAALVYIFQYLIGNTDWSIVAAEGDEFCCHNGNLYEIDSELYLVPYDFDLAGLVNARYAKPDPSLRISRVTKRLYRGYCTEPGALRAALERIIDNRSGIVGLLADTPGLSQKETRVARRYLERFFDRAGNQQRLLDHFQSRCL